MPTPIFVGEIQKNTNELWVSIDPGSQDALNEYRKKFKFDQKFKIVIKRLTKKKVRSVEQNSYYWGVVIKILSDHFGYIAPDEKEELHEALKAKFLVYIGPLGTPQVLGTSRINTKIFEAYLEAIRSWAAREYDIKIPLPNESEPDDEFIKLGEGV